MVLTAMQHEEWRGLNISVAIIPESILVNVNIIQITARLEQLDLSQCVQMHNEGGYAFNF